MKTFSILVLVVVVLCIPSQAVPCSCRIPDSLEVSFEKFDQAFLGQISVVRPRESDPPTDEITYFDVFIDVIDVYKGTPGSEVLGEAKELFRGAPEPVATSNCGTGVSRGRLFIVFRNDGEIPRFSGCSATIRYSLTGPATMEALRDRQSADA